MSNLEYIFKMLNGNAIIYLDTSVLMDVERITKFVDKYENVIKAKGKKLVVIQEVNKELEKFRCCSDNNEKGINKRAKAELACCLLKEHSEIFEIESGNNSTDYACADGAFISKMNAKRARCRQLLISNDQTLCSDIYGLNSMNSYGRYHISVCNLNYYGEIKAAKCVRQSSVPLCDNEKMHESTNHSGTGEKTYMRNMVAGTAIAAIAGVLGYCIGIKK